MDGLNSLLTIGLLVCVSQVHGEEKSAYRLGDGVSPLYHADLFETTLLKPRLATMRGIAYSKPVAPVPVSSNPYLSHIPRHEPATRAHRHDDNGVDVISRRDLIAGIPTTVAAATAILSIGTLPAVAEDGSTAELVQQLSTLQTLVSLVAQEISAVKDLTAAGAQKTLAAKDVVKAARGKTPNPNIKVDGKRSRASSVTLPVVTTTPQVTAQPGMTKEVAAAAAQAAEKQAAAKCDAVAAVAQTAGEAAAKLEFVAAGTGAELQALGKTQAATAAADIQQAAGAARTQILAAGATIRISKSYATAALKALSRIDEKRKPDAPTPKSKPGKKGGEQQGTAAITVAVVSAEKADMKAAACLEQIQVAVQVIKAAVDEKNALTLAAMSPSDNRGDYFISGLIVLLSISLVSIILKKVSTELGTSTALAAPLVSA